MDPLKDESLYTTKANSNVTTGTTNFTSTNCGPAVLSYQSKRRRGGIVGVRGRDASKGGASCLRNFKSPFTACSENSESASQNGNNDALISNSRTDLSSTKYRPPASFPPENTMPPLTNYGLRVGQGTSSLTITDSTKTAGAVGGGDAPYLEVDGNNPYTGTVTSPHHNNITDQHNREQHCNFDGGNAKSTDVAEKERPAQYSRKVFVGGLPPDINEEEIINSFRRFGPLVVDWPHKITLKSEYPPKGYAFVIFHEENSVQQLIKACMTGEDKLYLCVSSSGIKNKPVQIRPWRLRDASYIINPNIALDPRKSIFVGGVPRPLKAYELAMILNELYGGVCYAGIDTDPELKYPKGAARVVFYNQSSYIAAISARFVQIQHGDIEKHVEMKPYVLGNQLCDECKGQRCGGKFAAYFCTNLTCLQYYCAYCWAAIHAWPGRQYHKPLVKEGGARPRLSFRW